MLKVVMVTEHSDGTHAFHLSDGELFVMDIFDDIETVVGEVNANFENLGYNPYFTSQYENVEKVWGEGKVVYKDEGALH